MSADRHWIALDHAFTATLSAAQAAQAHTRFARRAGALSDIYLPRLLEAVHQSLGDDGDSTRQGAALRQAHRQLAAALTAEWSETR